MVWHRDKVNWTNLYFFKPKVYVAHSLHNGGYKTIQIIRKKLFSFCIFRHLIYFFYLFNIFKCESFFHVSSWKTNDSSMLLGLRRYSFIRKLSLGILITDKNCNVSHEQKKSNVIY